MSSLATSCHAANSNATIVMLLSMSLGSPGRDRRHFMDRVAILLFALLLDLAVGEFPRPFHPVVWIGQVITLEAKLAPRAGRGAQLAYGVGITLLTIALFTLAAYFLLAYLHGVSTVAYVLMAALLLKSTFAIKELRQVALRIRRFLLEGNLNQARHETKSLVKRDTSQLDEPHVVSATVESIAENTSDSIVAPLFYFLFFGVPGAVAYRVVNTLDAMIGYHGQFEYLGKFAARLDDGLNFIPSRLSGLLLVAAAHLYRQDSRRAWQVMLRDHSRTESPNAGWPMSAMAGALGVQLEKVGYYTLGTADRPLTIDLIPRGVRLVDISALLWAGFCLVMEVVFIAITA